MYIIRLNIPNYDQQVIKDDPKVIQDDQQVIQDDPKVIQDYPKVIQDEPKVIQDDPKVIQLSTHLQFILFYLLGLLQIKFFQSLQDI